MSKLEWSKIEIKHANKTKLIGDNGKIKIIIGGPLENGEFWWHVKVEEKGVSETIESARQDAIKSVEYEIEEVK